MEENSYEKVLRRRHLANNMDISLVLKSFDYALIFLNNETLEINKSLKKMAADKDIGLYKILQSRLDELEQDRKKIIKLLEDF